MSEEVVGIEIFERALMAHLDMSLDAFKHLPETLDGLFVEYGPQVQRLNTPDWQIIFGGSGTGKTHLLRVYEERSLRGAVAHDPTEVVESLPVYLDANAFASRQFLKDDERRAQACFRSFIDEFGECLEAAVTNLQSPTSIYARLRHRRRADAAKRALEVLQKVREELDYAKLRYPYHDQRLQRSSEQEDTRGRSAGAGGRLGASPAGPDASLSARAGAERGSRSAKREDETASGTGEPNWPRIRALIAELCRHLQVRRLDILIDNWPALDTYGTSAVQPHFAELLKKALGGDRGGHAISVKIAADGLATRLWDREGGVGLRRPTDIDMVVNLNEALLNDQELVQFFERLLFERLIAGEGRLGHLLDPDSPSTPLPAAFVRTLFGDRETFELLVRGAEGRTRLFLYYVREMTLETNGDLAEPFSRERVLAVVKARAAQEISEYQFRSPAVQLLLAGIKPPIVARGHAVFSISDVEQAKFRSEFHELRFKGLLDPDIPPQYRGQLRPDLIGYAVSKDLMREWHRARSIEQELQALLDGPSTSPGTEPTLADLRIYLEGGPDEPDQA